MSPSSAVVNSFLCKAKMTKKELQVREKGIRWSVHLLGKAKVKKWEYEVREEEIRGNV